jgi:hypothetical protein
MCLTPLPTICQLYRGCQLYWWGKCGTQENHRPVASHLQTLSHFAISGIRTRNVRGDVHSIV